VSKNSAAIKPRIGDVSPVQAGWVKWYNPNDNYGFVVLNPGDNRGYFVHASELDKANIGSLIKGQKVSFCIKSLGSNKSEVVELNLIADPKTTAKQLDPTEQGEKFSGFIKEINEKGFGYITRDDGAKDVFVHKNTLNASRLNQQDVIRKRVFFKIGKGNKAGRTQAVSIQIA